MAALDEVLKRIVSRLPRSHQMHLRKMRYRWLIRSGRFDAGEPEFDRTREWVARGDWVIDVGANIGTYTMALSRIVGPEGRVIALEPVPSTFQLLTAHVGRMNTLNVTLLNLAASDETDCANMRVPTLKSGLDNIYQARISEVGDCRVLTIPLDVLAIKERVRLIKVDVEGHELRVLRGALRLIKRDQPVLILEGDLKSFGELLIPLGYTKKRFAQSPNTVYLPSWVPGAPSSSRCHSPGERSSSNR